MRTRFRFLRPTVMVALLAMLAVPLGAPPASGQVMDFCTALSEGPGDPPPWVEEMPAAKETSYSAEEVQIESKDGTQVSAKVYLPDAYEGQPLPTVVVMSPYHAFPLYWKELEQAQVIDWADCITKFLLPRGYAVVLADMRGTHNSDGCFDFGGPGDQQDGHATVQWIAEQDWSNGKVGMYGVSHPGMSQYATALTAPAALKAILPIAPITSFWRYLYSGGVHYETNMLTPAAYEYAVSAPPPTNVADSNYPTNVVGTTCNTENVIRGMSLDGEMTEYWKERDYPSMASKIRAAVFHVHGTLDENVKMDHFDAMWDALESAGVARKALIGPWQHSEPNVPWWHYHALRWFEHWLNDNDTGMMKEPKITVIDQDKIVRTADTWPPAPKHVVLEASGEALVPKAQSKSSASYQDVFMFPRDRLRETEEVRLLYTSEQLSQPVRLSGAPEVEVVASINTTDTNFAVHLYDVAEGEARYVTRGYLDARLREGYDKPKPVEPGKEYRYRVVLHGREYIFEKGHQIQVLIASSDSCHWGVVLSCTSSGVVSDPTAAQVTVSEGPGQTRLILPAAPVSKGKRLI